MKNTLHGLVRKIARIHPWYDEELRLLGLSQSERMSGLSLSGLPLMDAKLLEKHYYASTPNTGGELAVYRTSGTSSGVRKAIYYSPEDDAAYLEAKLIPLAEWLGDDAGRSIAGALADVGTGHAASTALELFARLGLKGKALSFQQPVREHVEALRKLRPQLLYTMPSLLEAIADAAPDAAELGLKRILLVGELASPEWQGNMAKRFGLRAMDVLDTYGSIEIGAIAAYSHELGRYVLDEGLYGEIVGAEMLEEGFGPLAPDEGVLVLTSFRRTLFPAIRFVTYDVVRDFKTINWKGKQRHTFACITKRIGPELKHGEKISLYDIEAAVHRLLPDASVRVSACRNSLAVYIKSAKLQETPELLPILRDEIQQAIPDIGAMIQAGMLNDIQVSAVEDWHSLAPSGAKAKRLYQQ